MKRKIYNCFMWSLIIVLFLFVCYTLYNRFVLKNQEIDVFGYRFYVVLSGSMESEINLNDVAIVKKSKNYEKNDVVAYMDDGYVTIHRIIEKTEIADNEYSYITKGDNNNKAHELPVNTNQIKGKYVGKIPKIGVIVSLIFRNIPLFILSIITLMFIIILIKVVRQKYSSNKKGDDTNGEK